MAAVVLALILVACKRPELGWLLSDQKWLALPVSLAVGATLSTIGVMAYEGVVWSRTHPDVNVLVPVLAGLAAFVCLIEFRFSAITVPFLDSLVAAALIGVAVAVGSFGWPMVVASSFPVLPWACGAAGVAAVVRIAIHEAL